MNTKERVMVDDFAGLEELLTAAFQYIEGVHKLSLALFVVRGSDDDILSFLSPVSQCLIVCAGIGQGPSRPGPRILCRRGRGDARPRRRDGLFVLSPRPPSALTQTSVHHNVMIDLT